MSRNKLNQCQDCGCPGGKIVIRTAPFPRPRGWAKQTYYWMECPYCGRSTKPVIGSKPVLHLIDLRLRGDWNMANRDNKEGLA